MENWQLPSPHWQHFAWKIDSYPHRWLHVAWKIDSYLHRTDKTVHGKLTATLTTHRTVTLIPSCVSIAEISTSTLLILWTVTLHLHGKIYSTGVFSNLHTFSTKTVIKMWWSRYMIKRIIKFSSYIRKFRMEQLQSHIWLTASSYIVKYLRISSYIRKPFLIYDFATAPFWISLYMRKIWFSFLSVYSWSWHAPWLYLGITLDAGIFDAGQHDLLPGLSSWWSEH